MDRQRHFCVSVRVSKGVWTALVVAYPLHPHSGRFYRETLDAQVAANPLLTPRDGKVPEPFVPYYSLCVAGRSFAGLLTGGEVFLAPRCLVWVALGGQPPSPPGIWRVGACRQAMGSQNRGRLIA